jgi:hypothetical protein
MSNLLYSVYIMEGKAGVSAFLLRWLHRYLVVFDIDHLISRRKLVRRTNFNL